MHCMQCIIIPIDEAHMLSLTVVKYLHIIPFTALDFACIMYAVVCMCLNWIRIAYCINMGSLNSY